MPTPNRELTRIPDAGDPARSPSVKVSVAVEYARPQAGHA